jgi:hypothetical protein
MAGFAGYDNYSLLDVYEWRAGFFCVIMLCPAGIHETLVFDCRDVYVPKKKMCGEMREDNIPVPYAVRLAKSAIEHSIECTGGF